MSKRKFSNKDKEEWEIWDSAVENDLKEEDIDSYRSQRNRDEKYDKIIKEGTISSEEYQIKTIYDIIDIWDDRRVGICTALTGAGKTYISALAAKLWKADKVFVIGPLISGTKWRDVLRGTGIEENKIHFFTYHSVINAGSSENELYHKNPWIYKVAYQKRADNGKIVSGYNFYPSKKWKDLVNNNRIVLIFDEYHKLQKQSQRTYAGCCLSRYILKNKNDSRVLCLSYTPNDNADDIPMNMYLFNLIATNKIIKYDREEKVYDVSELRSLLSLCLSFTKDGKLSTEERRMLNSTYPSMIDALENYHCKTVSKTTVLANKIASELYLTYIKRYITVTCIADWMKDPKLIPNYNNIFYRVTPHTFNKISSLIEGGGNKKLLSKFRHVKNNKDAILMAKLNDMQHKMEIIKTNIYISIARKILSSDPNRKVVIIVLFLDVLRKIEEALSEYNPLIMHGDIKESGRIKRLELFNRHDNKHRLFIATQETGGESIDLHDTSPGGKYPRSFLIPPNFKTKNVVQVSGRGFRQGVTSKCDIIIVYTLHSSFDENKIDDISKLSMIPISFSEAENDLKGLETMIPEVRFYNTIANKTGTIKKTQACGQNGKLPFEYEPIIVNEIYETVEDRRNFFINGYQRPNNNVGDNGQYYLDIENQLLYGPKEGKWPNRGIKVSSLEAIDDGYPSDDSGEIWSIINNCKYNMLMLKTETGWTDSISTKYLHIR